jgi:hypothetical protein
LLMAVSLILCVVSALAFLGGWIAMIVVSSTNGSFSREAIDAFTIAGPIVYPLWLVHYIVVLVNLNGMVKWMQQHCT